MINPGAMRTPHWHANANELTYCVSGTALVSVLDTGSQFSSFIVGAGEMFHVDSGSLHHIENIGADVAEFIIAFRHERPEDFGLGAAFGAMTDAVLGNTYDLPASDFATIRRNTTDRRAGRPPRRSGGTGNRVLQRSAQVRCRSAEPADQHCRRLGPPGRACNTGRRSRTCRCTRCGSARTACGNRTGTRSPPRWATSNGSARMTVMGPDGDAGHLVPAAGRRVLHPPRLPAPHRGLRRPRMHFAIFFDQPTPGDIGYRASVSAYSREVLAATFNMHIDDLPNFPFTKADPLIVNRNNPLDDHTVGES